MFTRAGLFFILPIIAFGLASCAPGSGTNATNLESLRASSSPEILTDLPENRGANDLNQLKEGMTINQVADFLGFEVVNQGSDVQTMQTILKGPETIVKLFNPDGRTFVLIFKEEKLASKAFYTAAEAVHLK